ncbi:MAG TPA: serine/threonine-protein phosphatase [Desulfobulbaceae bacterium]|nr:serine/threonine-protein phosphatase [Desulfobulbaceae bacterium]
MKRHTQILACSKTDPGLQRLRNEDVCQADTVCGFFLVADGMGGRAAGNVASQLFREAVMEVFSADEELGLTEGEAKVREAFSLANRKILAHVDDNPHHSGMGCTAELLIFCQNRYLIGHVGDSRTYLLRHGSFRQLTKDHSMVENQIDQGLLSRQEARHSRFRNILLQAVGSAEELAIDLLQGDLRKGDIFLLCSDGLHGMMDDEAIRSVLAFDAPLDFKTGMLVNMANDAGGRDNITVVLAEVQG